MVLLLTIVTEVPLAFGLGTRVVGTNSCAHPPDQIVTEPKLGGTKNSPVATSTSAMVGESFEELLSCTQVKNINITLTGDHRAFP